MRRLAATLVVAAVGWAAAGAVAEADVPATRPLAVLLNDHVVRAAPSFDARRVEVVRERRPLTKVRTALPVVDEAPGGSWLRVRLPGRPNGHTGWIRAAATHRSSTPWLVTVRLSTRRVTVFQHGRVVRRFRAVIGAPSTPTPRGRFFVEEAVALGRSEAGGPYALALSARSNVFQEFNGGPGQTALHGTAGLSGSLGTAASHGCLRLSTEAITWLARRLGPGVPLNVRR